MDRFSECALLHYANRLDFQCPGPPPGTRIGYISTCISFHHPLHCSVYICLHHCTTSGWRNIPPPGYCHLAMYILLPSIVTGDRGIILFHRIYYGSNNGRITHSENNNPWYYSLCRGSRSTGVCGMETARTLIPKGSGNAPSISQFLSSPYNPERRVCISKFSW
jgi:hypothetical protein